MRVKATKTGFYNHIRRREGDVFTLIPVSTVERDEKGQVKFDATGNTTPVVISPDKQFSPRWMEKVSNKAREAVSTAQGSVNKQHDDIVRGRTPNSVAA